LESRDVDPTPAHGARRELAEEANVSLPLDAFASVGTLSFTFRDRNDGMVVHLFHADVQFREDVRAEDGGDEDAASKTGIATGGAIIDQDAIRGCDEIIPRWFSWSEIPLRRMFADDSVWLTHFLSEKAMQGIDEPVKMNGWFHFGPGGDEGNKIEHYFLDV